VVSSTTQRRRHINGRRVFVAEKYCTKVPEQAGVTGKFHSVLYMYLLITSNHFLHQFIATSIKSDSQVIINFVLHVYVCCVHLSNYKWCTMWCDCKYLHALSTADNFQLSVENPAITRSSGSSNDALSIALKFAFTLEKASSIGL